VIHPALSRQLKPNNDFMNHFIFYCLFLLSFLPAAVAQTENNDGTFTGTLTSDTGEPLADVNIYIREPKLGAFTDQLGRFKINHVPPGTHAVEISAIGYEAQTVTVQITAGETASLSVVLKPGNIVLSDLVISGLFERQVNTISSLDIRLRPANTSQDVLRMVPGLFIAQHAGGGKAEQILLRGFDIDHGTDIDLDVDGLPVNMVSHAHGQGYSDLHFLIPEVVRFVDFNKGPYYAEHGNFTTAGYASFQTKNTLEQNMVKIEGGRFGTLRNVNAFNLLNREQKEQKHQAYIASELFRSDGFFESNQHFTRLNMMGKYTGHLNDHQMLTIGLSTFTSEWDASGQIPERAVRNGLITRYGSLDDTEGGETSRSHAYVRFITSGRSGSTIENQLYYIAYDFDLVSNFTFFLNDPDNGDQITQRESRNIYGYRGSILHNSSLGGMDLQTESGIGFRQDHVKDLRLMHTRARKEFFGDFARGDVDETNLYAYVKEILHLSPRLSINAALRLDHFTFNYVDALTAGYDRQSVSKAILSPKLNISYNAGRRVNLFVKTGTGFHSNDTRVVVARKGEDVLPRAFGADVGGSFKVTDKLLLTATLWRLDLDQEFVYVGDEGIVEPGGKTSRSGIDFSLRYQVNDWLYVDSDINLTDPRLKGAPEGEDHIPLAPTFSSIGGLTIRLGNGLNGSLRYRYLDDRAANEDNSVVADGYFLADAVVKYTLPGMEFSVSAENIFNSRWNEAQFDTTSRLLDEPEPVSEIHFTPGTPFFLKAGVSIFF
jgi:outer membrane cobalamin receptor